jgi:hypothetical protein
VDFLREIAKKILQSGDFVFLATARQVHFPRSSEVMNDWVSSGLGRLGGGEGIGFGLRGWGMGDGRGLNDGR